MLVGGFVIQVINKSSPYKHRPPILQDLLGAGFLPKNCRQRTHQKLPIDHEWHTVYSSSVLGGRQENEIIYYTIELYHSQLQFIVSPLSIYK